MRTGFVRFRNEGHFRAAIFAMPAAILCGCCGQSASRSSTPTMMAASTRPSPSEVATTRPAHPPMRLTNPAPISPQLALLLEDQNAYLTKEGLGHRGPLFLQLCGRLSVYQHSEPSFTLEQTFELLGLPDSGDVDSSGAVYVYLIDRFASKDWSLMVFAQGNQVTQIGTNDAKANDFSKLRQYKNWSDVQISPPVRESRGWIGQLFQ